MRFSARISLEHHTGRMVGKPVNESPATTCDSLNFLFARDSVGIANTPSAYSHLKAEPKARHRVILRLVK